MIALAGMIHTDKNALVCDMAETYGIYDMGLLPVQTVATLAAGLGADSRVKRKQNNMPVSTDTLLLALAVDKLNLLWWAQTKDGQKNRGRPDSLVAELLGIEQKQKNIIRGDKFTIDQFNAAREALIEKMKGGAANG